MVTSYARDFWKFNPNNVTGMKQISENSVDLKIYPNPANAQLYIETTYLKNTRAEIFNIEGELLQSVKLENKKTVVQINTLPSGLYLIKVINTDGAAVKKFIKN